MACYKQERTENKHRCCFSLVVYIVAQHRSYSYGEERLITIIIRTISDKMTNLTTLEAGVISLRLAFVGMLLATFERYLEALDDEGHFILV